MIHDPRPIAPINPKGLDDIAKSLLDEAYAPRVVAPSDISNPESYMILEGKQHGTYSYPDLFVRIHRLGFNEDVRKIAQNLGLTLQNTAQEQNNVPYIGNINHKQAIDIVKGLNFIPLTLRLEVDFLKEIKSGIDGKIVYDGKGGRIKKEDLQNLWDEITEVRDPWRGEWFDNSFTKQRRKLYAVYHSIQSDGTLKETTVPLEDCLMKDKTPGIDMHDWLKKANPQGLPPEDVKNGSLHYWHPVNERVARFMADSVRAYLDCYGDSQSSDSGLGVRVAKIKA